MRKYRIYVDETGTHDMRRCKDPNNKYLGLTGIIIDLRIVREMLVPQMEQIKQQFFPYDPDSPPIFHRKDIINKKYPFHALHDPNVESKFNETLLDFLSKLEYKVISVVIDKLKHKETYRVWRYHPYHYCLAVMLERLVYFLEDENAVGDVMAESRGGKEDRKLKESFTNLYDCGSEYISSERFQAVLTSRQLKVKPKKDNIAGLQLADVIAYPSRQEILRLAEQISDGPSTFGDRIVEILKGNKYYRNNSGIIDGYGRKFLP